MSRKRVVAREWKRKRKQQRLIFKACVFGILFVIALIVALVLFNQYRLSYVMRFEGQRVSVSEYQFMGDVESLTDFLLIEQAAARHNITPTEEEREGSLDLARQLTGWGMAPPNLSLDRMADFLGEPTLRTGLVDIYAADYAPDEEALAADLEHHLEFNRENYLEMSFTILETMTSGEALRVVEALNDAEGPDYFEPIILEFFEESGVDIEDPEFEMPTAALADLRQGEVLTPEVLAQLAEMEAGTVSEPVTLDLEWGSVYVVFIADSRHMPTDEEIAEAFRENRIQEARSLIFEEVLAEWREAADVQLNERALRALEG